MQAGKLDTKVRIESPVETTNSLGERILTWVTFLDNVFMGRRNISAREKFSSETEQAEVDTILFGRYMKGVDSRMRVYDYDRELVYGITGVVELGRRRGHELQCTTRVS